MAAIELNSTPLISDANLVDYYRAENVNDSKDGYTLTNNNSVAFNAAKFNNGFDLGASNSTKYLNNNTAIFSPLANYTISLWVKLQTEIGSGIYEFLHFENNTNKHVIYIKYEYNGGTRRLNFGQDKWLVVGYTALNTITLGTSVWTHLVFTMSTRVMQIYVNGAAAGTTATFTVVDYTTGDTATNNQLLVGAGSTPGTGTIINYSSAILDDVVIFNRALTATEISDLYNGNWPSGGGFFNFF